VYFLFLFRVDSALKTEPSPPASWPPTFRTGTVQHDLDCSAVHCTCRIGGAIQEGEVQDRGGGAKACAMTGRLFLHGFDWQLKLHRASHGRGLKPSSASVPASEWERQMTMLTTAPFYFVPLVLYHLALSTLRRFLNCLMEPWGLSRLGASSKASSGRICFFPN
jgi:hypothetical protein